MTAKNQSEAGVVEVKQIRSGIGFNKKQKATLKAMGLGKVGRVRKLTDNDQTRGMIAKIPHLVVVVGGAKDA